MERPGDLQRGNCTPEAQLGLWSRSPTPSAKSHGAHAKRGMSMSRKARTATASQIPSALI